MAHRVLVSLLVCCAILGQLAAVEGEDSAAHVTVEELETKKAVLEKQKALLELIGALRKIATASSSAAISGFVEEAEALLAQARDAADDKEKLAILKDALGKKKEWAAKLAEIKTEVEQAHEADRAKQSMQGQDSDAAADVNDKSDEAAEMVVSTARMFHQAVRDGNEAVVKKFLAALDKTESSTRSKIINWQDSLGVTALHWCAFYGTRSHETLTETLMNLPDVDMRLQDKHNRTACDTACMKGSANVLSRFISRKDKNGCDPFKLSFGGFSCVHMAAQRGDAETLLALKPVLSAEHIDAFGGSDKEQKTALFMAVEAGSVEAGKILVDAGASKLIGRKFSGPGDNETSHQGVAEYAQSKLEAYRSISKLLGDPSADPSDRHEL